MINHLPHLEDLMLENRGLDLAMSIVDDLGAFLTDNRRGRVELSEKWDGAPSVVMGLDHQGFYVGTKSAFAATPKRARVADDIDRMYSSNVAHYLHYTFALLGHLKPVFDHRFHTLQGDVLFTEPDKFEIVSSHERVIAFQPNTLVYTVPSTSVMGGVVQGSVFGLALHSMNDGQPLPSHIFSTLPVPRGVMALSCEYDYARAGKFTDTEATAFALVRKLMVSMARQVALGSSESVLRDLNIDGYVQMWLNDEVRQNHVRFTGADLAGFLSRRCFKEVSQRKTEAARMRKVKMFDDMIMTIGKHRKDIDNWCTLHNLIGQLKVALIGKLAQSSDFKTFLRNADRTLKPTTGEGYVVRYFGKPVKLVNRHEFSRANFARHDTVSHA